MAGRSSISNGEQAVIAAAKEIFPKMPIWCWPCGDIAVLLEEEHVMNPYGYFRFLLTTMGKRAIFKNVQTSKNLVNRFKVTYAEEVRLFSERLSNAHKLIEQTLKNGSDLGLMLEVCEFHSAAIYLILRAISCMQYAKQYKDEALDYFR